MIFRQLFDEETNTYTYILGDEETRETIIIDTVIEQLDRDVKLLKELDLKPKYFVDTHVHADHTTGALHHVYYYPNSKSVLGMNAKDLKNNTIEYSDRLMKVKDGDKLEFGKYSLLCIETPGHTSGCMSFVTNDKSMVFTGDALFVRGTGRTDFQGGSAKQLYDSIQKIFKLPNDCKVYPGHDYNGHLHSTIDEEKKYNPRVGNNKSKEEFVKIMNDLKLPNPKKIEEAVPANARGGVRFKIDVVDNVSVAPQFFIADFHQMKKDGVKTFVQLRGEKENGFNLNREKKEIESLGMKYIYHPTLPQDFKDDHMKSFLEKVQNIEEPICVGCRTATRARCLALMYLKKKKGKELNDEEECKKVKHEKLCNFTKEFLKKI